MNLSTENKLMDIENRLVVAKAEGEGEGLEWIRNLGLIDANYCLCECISNEILLYSTGNYIYSFMMDHEDRVKKECIHVCATGSHCYKVENWQNIVNKLQWKKNHYIKKKKIYCWSMRKNTSRNIFLKL